MTRTVEPYGGSEGRGFGWHGPAAADTEPAALYLGDSSLTVWMARHSSLL